jgi:hypothetical protein
MHQISKPMRRVLLIALSATVHHAHAQEQDHPADHWEMAVEVGYLTKIKHNSPLNYVLARPCSV